MVSKNNFKNKMEQTAARTPHYGIRKLSVGVASVLISTTLYMGATTAKADTLPSTATDAATTKPEATSSSSSTQANATADKTVETTTGVANDSTDTSVSTTPNAQASTTNTTAGATSSDKSGANSNSLVANNVESTANTTAQAQPKTTDVVDSDKANVGNQVGSNVENKATTTTGTISTPTTPKRVVRRVRSLAAAPTTVNDPVDLTKWEYNVDSLGDAHVLSYNGDVTQPIYIPNSYDFIQAGKITAEHKAFITSGNMQKLAGSGTHELYISKNGDGKVIAEDSDWSGTFCGSKYDSGRNGQLSETIDKNLEKLDLTNLDVTNIKNMKNMFSFDSQLTSIGDLSNWNTSNVTDMSDMFGVASKLTNIGDLSNWNTGNVTDMSEMFFNASSLTNIGDLSNWNTSKVTNMSSMFSDASSLTNIGDLSNWDTHNVTAMGYMFSGASKLTNIGDLSNWDTHNVTAMNDMFSGASKLTNIGDLSNWDTSKVTYMNDMFRWTSQLTNIGNLSSWNTSNVDDMRNMFNGASSLTNIGNLSNWDTHNVTDMRNMFYGASSLTNIGDLSNWDTSKVTDMRSMFNGESKLTNIGDLSNWDTSNVTNMSHMFDGASKLTNIGDLSNWDTSKVTDMNGMFSGASQFTNIGDLSNWDTSKVTDMRSMFNGESKLTNIGDLSNWNTSNVMDMSEMFFNASGLTNIGDLSNWDTSKVIDMGSMFSGTSKLTNIGDLSNWNVNKVFNSENMMFGFGEDSKEPILQNLPSFTKTKNSVYGLPIFATGTGVYDARGVTSSVQGTSADNYDNNHIVLTSDTSLLDHSNISNNVNNIINQITINGNKIALPVFYKDYQDLHDTVQKTIDDYAEKLRSQGKIVKNTPKVADYSTESTTDWLKYFTNYTIDVVNQTKINYVDTDGTTIHTTVIEGKSGETVSVPNEIPTGYKLVAGLSVPTEITFTADGYPITNLTIEAIHTTVTADNPKTTADKLPDNPTKNYPEGVSESDLNKTVTRTINITDLLTQKVTPVVQTVHLTRSADVDEITGEVVYSDWTTSSFDSYNVPEVPGYTATVQSIDEAPVDINSKDQTVDVSYTANPQSIKVNYVDSDNNDSVVKSDTLSGKTDQTVKTDIDIPDGYVVEGNVPSDYTFKAKDNADITIKLKHGTITVASDSPKTTADKLPDNPSKNYPSGVAEKDLNKIVTRTIKVTDPQGKVTTTTQTVHLTRSATVDEVTGEVTYSNWSTGSFDSYDVPEIEGYTATQSNVDTAKVTSNTQNSEVNVTYTANPQSIKINYVDDEKGGATVKSDTLNGKTDETVKTGITIPENYSVVGTTPSEYTFKSSGNTDITVHLKHVIDTTSEEKTITRTIKVTDQTGKVTTIPQTAKVTRTVSTDKVTNEKTYGDWTTSSFDSYDVPEIEGYTASQSTVDEAIVDGNSKDSEVNISYTANDQAIKINYVDSDNNSSVVKSDTLSGKTDQTVKTGIIIPDGYVIEGNVPTDYTFKASGNTDITVKLKHGTTIVAPDNPKTTNDKLPDNPNKNYPNGVAENDLNKTVTRTIKVTKPQGKVTTETQTVHLTRTATVDEVTGDVTYSDWSTGSFDGYDVPTIEGYTASQSTVDEVKVTSDTQNNEVNISYTANPQSIKVNYVDSDNNDSVVKSDTLSGKTDQTVKTGVEIPDGYVVSGNVPTDYTFKATDNADITVHLIHNKVTVTPDSPKTTADKLPDNPAKAYPDGVSQNDLNKSVTRTINVTDPKGKVTTEIQTVHLTRTATVDEVTGQVTYSDWTTGSFDSYDVPSVDGYTASQDKVDTDKVTSDTQNSEVNISYTANSQSIKINYVDGDNGDSIVKTDTLTGKTDETIKTGIKVPNGYVIDGNVPDSYTFKAKDNTDITVKLKHGTTTVTANNPKTINDKLPDNPTKSYPEGVGQNDLNKTVTRTIKVTTPDGETTTTIQTVHLTRTATVDEVTGEVTYGDWSTGSFDNYVVPSVDGYTASQDKVDTATVTSDTQNSEVNITYTANPQSIKVNYVDSDNGGAMVKSEALSGKTDETVKTNISIPDGYVVESNVPNDYTFKAKDNVDITIKLKHGTTTVTPDNPKTTNDKLPDNPTKSYPSGVGQNDLNKTVTRTIKITDPQDKVTTETQTVHLTRSATVDEVTGDVTYSDWSTGSFDGYDVPTIEGYTPTQSKVDEVKVTSDTQNSEVNISYTANDQAIKINYVDSDNNGSVIKSDTLSGKTDQTVKTGITIPDGYVIEGNVPNDYTFKASGNTDITVKLKHGTTTVTPDNPKTVADKLPDNPNKNYPSGVSENDLNKDVTRTIKVTDPTGKVTTTTQTVHLTRTATVDEVTGKVTYGDWTTGSFDSYDVPSVEGYTASQDKVDTATVTSDTQDSEVNITYTANKQVISIDYVDNGKVISTQVLTGKTDETVETNIQSPDKDKYVVVGTNPDTYTFKAKGNEDIRVEVKHVINDSTESKDVTRTIVVTSPDGKETTKIQKATVSRTVHTDAVTGAKTYDEWSKATLDKYNVPTVDGYTPSLNVVEGLEVDGNNEDSVVKVGYTANPQSIKVNYVDEDNGSSTVKTETLNGKTDQTVKTGIEIPDGYVVEGQVPTDYTFKAKDNADITVKLKHGTTTVTADNPKTTDDKLPDNPSKSYPSGVGQNDLNKDVTRTIKVTDPTGKVTTETQTVHLTRTATVDEVTGNVTYGDWTTGSFDSYDVPSVEGYTASQDKVEGTPVTADSTNSEVNISYTANDQSIKINYVDNNGGTTVKSDTLNGKTDQTVKTGITIPDGYVVDGNVPTDYTFKAKDNADITVHLTHNNVTVTADNPKTTNDKLPDNPNKTYPEGVAESDLNKDVTRTIKVTDPKGKVTTTTQTVHLTRTATVDEVTGKVTYGDWTTGSFDSYDVPSVEGYTASQDKVDTDKVTSDSTNSEVNISYTANDQTAKVVYVDEDNGGSTVKTDTLSGKTDQTVETGVKVPDGYVVDGQVPADYTFKAKDNADVTVKLKHGTTTVTPDKPKTANDKLPDNPTKSYPSGVAENDLNKDVTRTIKVTDPTGKVTTETQTVHLTRTATVDEVTGKVTYGDWSTGSFGSYDVPSVDGYTASQVKVDETKVTSDTQNSEVNISYTANNQTAKVVYIDGDNGGSTVKTDILKGKTDETVKTGIKVPDGYVVESNVPTDYTFKSKDNADITVKLKHGTTTVTPDKPKTTNDKLPDNPSKSYPSGVAENDLNKTVTRTIKVTDPKGKVTTTTQTVHLTRTATVDEVTGKVSYGDWTTGSFDSYVVPSVEGYTASQAKVDEAKVTADSKNSEVNITYTANNQSAKIVYVDRDNGDSIVKTDTLNGKTDQTVKTGIETPDGYVVEGQVPTDYTFKAKDNADITVHLTHNKATVTPDKPKTTADKLPNNPTKSYPDGVGQNDLNKTVTRTIKVTTPDGKTSTTTQTVHLTRTATVDEVTGKVSYDDWSTSSFDSYDVPSVDGYTASQVKVDEIKVTSDSTNNEVNITYTANPQSIKINYVDDDKSGTTVKSDTLNGKTDETVKTGIEIPTGYIANSEVPSEYSFKANGNTDITVHLKHEIKTDADYKNVLRTIKVTLPNGKSESLVQVATLSREVKTDKVTNNVSYGSWSSDKFTSYKLPSIEGYTPSLDVVNEAKVDGNTEDSTVEVNYTANKQSAKVVYVDNGKVVATQTLTGKTDQTVKTNIQSPDKDKYVVVGNNPENYTFKAKDNEDIKVEVKHVVNTFKDYKNVIRSIEVTYPNGKTEKLDQVATLERTVHKDAVTGEETYSDWSTENWDSFTAPAINGYTADKDVKETVVTGDTTETTVSIVYTANEQATKIVYVDNDKSGSIVKTDTLNGKTDQTVKTDVKVPDGYVLEGNVPDNYTFTAGDNFDIIVHLRHGIVKVTPDKPKTTADKLPDSSKTYPEGVGQDNLNKTITRTIKVTTPDGKISTTTQTAHLIRTARVDETTGQVTYDDWTTGSFDSYDVPSVDGYTASQAKVEETKVTSDSQDSEVNISYTANKQSIKVVYVDGDNSGSTVKTDTLTGKTDETVKTGIEIPDGYEVDGQVPSEYSFKAKDNADITVHLKHSTVTVIPEKPKTTEDKLPNNPSKSYPKGVAENDLNKTVVRTIKVTTPDGKTTTTKQTVKLNRVAVVDEVTGQVTYSKWSLGELDRYDVPVVDGYTPSQDRVSMEVANSETKDSVVEITYAPNGQSINITYVDDDKGETTVDSYILAGKTDETVKTGIKIPDGYEVEGQVPTDYTFKAKDNTDITVRLKHKLDKGTETKTVSRIVEITLPDGQTKTIKQEQTLKRSKTTDLVTGDVVYGEWSKAEFDEVVAPEVDGYKPSQAKVEKETVDGNSSDQVVKITYKKVKSDVKVEAKPTVEAKHEAKVQVAPKVEAKASAKPQAKAQPKFVTTELPQTGEKQSKGTTVGAILVGLGSLLGLGALGKRKEK